jgi:hypothetical protein
MYGSGLFWPLGSLSTAKFTEQTRKKRVSTSPESYALVSLPQKKNWSGSPSGLAEKYDCYGVKILTVC